MTTVTYVHGGKVNTRLLSLFMTRSDKSKVGLSDLLQLLFRRHVCLSNLNTRRHARYRWPPPKLCSAIILRSQYWGHANVINDVRNASSKRLCHGCLLHCVHVASYGIYSNKHRPRLSARRPRLSSTPSSDTRGSQSGREKRRDESFQVLSKEPLAALIRVNTIIGDMNVMKQSAMTQPL